MPLLEEKKVKKVTYDNIRGLEGEIEIMQPVPFMQVLHDFKHPEVTTSESPSLFARTRFRDVCFFSRQEPEISRQLFFVSADILQTSLKSSVVNALLDTGFQGVLTIEMNTPQTVIHTILEWVYLRSDYKSLVLSYQDYLQLLYHYWGCLYLTTGLERFRTCVSKRELGKITIRDIMAVPEELQHPYPWIQHLLIRAHNNDVDKGFKDDYTGVPNSLLVRIMNIRSGKEQCDINDDHKYMVVEDDRGKRYVSEIVEETTKYTLVHFLGWGPKDDEKIPWKQRNRRIKSIQEGGQYWCYNCNGYHKTKEKMVQDVRNFISLRESSDVIEL